MTAAVVRRHPVIECLESRVYLTGNPVANNDSYVMAYYAGGSVSGPGVLANDTDPNPGATLTAHLATGPSHSTSFGLNSDGSFHYATYNTFLGQDSFTYYVTDNFGYSSNTATVTLNVEYSVSATTDLTKQVTRNRPLPRFLSLLLSLRHVKATSTMRSFYFLRHLTKSTNSESQGRRSPNRSGTMTRRIRQFRPRKHFNLLKKQRTYSLKIGSDFNGGWRR